jgi:hypothetical protein
MNPFLAKITAFLRPVSLSALSQDAGVMKTARTLVAYYYYVLPYVAMLFLTGSIRDRSNFEPFWPLSWVSWTGIDFLTTISVIKLYFLAVAVAAIFLHRHRIVRILAFVAIWQVHGLESSFGYINHQWYEWMYTSFIFIFLPDIWKKESGERNRFFLLYIWFAQAAIALTYTLAGTHKLLTAISQGLNGEIGGFHPLAFAYRVAEWVPKLQAEALLAPYVVEYPYWGWAPYVFIQFFQFLSLWVMVRVRLQRIWAGVLILFHIGVVLTMGISFHPLVILIVVMFLNSPFLKPYASFSEFLLDLPIIGQVYERLRRRTVSG